VARVLARAVELAAVDLDGPEGVPVWVVEAAAAEVGVEAGAVHQAIAELRAGLLAAPGAPRPADVVVRRHVPMAPERVAAALAAHLRRQRFVEVRHQASLQRWRRRSDLASALCRSADVRGRLQLQALEEVVVRLVDLPGGTIVQVEAALRPGWRHAGWWGAAPGTACAAVVAAGALLTPVPDVAAAVAAPAALVAAGGGAALGRRARRRGVATTAEELEGWFDRLEHPPPGARPGYGLGRLQGLVRERWTAWRVVASPPPPPPPPPPPRPR
jgi:hypothetical protein